MTEPVKTLDEMQAGDPCVVTDGFGTPFLETVRRATKLHLEAVGRKFRRKGGGEVNGDQWRSWDIEPATPDAVSRAEAAQERMSQMADRRDLLHRAGILSRTGSIEKVRAVLTLLREYAP